MQYRLIPSRERGRSRPVIAMLVVLPMLAVSAGCAAGSADAGVPGFGRLLLQTFALLVVVCVLAVVTLRMAAKYGIGGLGRGGRSARIEVLERTPVGGRQHVLALRVGKRVLIVAQTQTAMRTLTELPLDEWQAQTGFSAVLESIDPDRLQAAHASGIGHDADPDDGSDATDPSDEIVA